MSTVAVALATLATSGAALVVLLIFAPALQAPFLVPKFAALELCAALAWMAFLLGRTTTAGPRWSRPVSMGALLVVATSGLAWVAALTRPEGAPYAIDALARWGALLGVACGSSVLAGAAYARRRALGALTIAAATVAIVGLLQHIGAVRLGIPIISMPGSTFGNRNGAAEVMAMTLPLGLGVAATEARADARGMMYVGLLFELLYLAVTRARGAWLGAICGIGATLWCIRPKWTRASLAFAIGAALAAAAFASLPGHFNPRDAGDRKRYSGVVELLQEGFDAQSTALRTRFGLWRRTLSMIRDHPLLGVGPGNWPREFPIYAEPDAEGEGVLSATLAPRQAHNDILERASETGIPGALALVFFAGAVWTVARRRMRTSDEVARTTTAGAAGSLVALVTLGVASFPLEMPGTLAVSGIALGVIAADPRGAAASRAPGGSAVRIARVLASVGAGLLVISIGLVRAGRSYRSSFWLGVAEHAMHRDRGMPGAAVAIRALDLALQAQPTHFRSKLRSAQALLRLGRAPESAHAAQDALAVEPYSPNAWAALAAAELASGDPTGARHSATRALAILHDFPFALQLRAQAAEQDGDLVAARADLDNLAALAHGTDDTARAAKALLTPTN